MPNDLGADVERVLVTGAGGFIGRHLVADQLSRGRDVVALDIHVGALDPLVEREPERLQVVEGDVADREVVAASLGGVDVVMHLAAAHLSVTAGPAEFRRVNVDAVRQLIELCARARVRRFVHCSTVGVYGALAVQPADEESPCRPELDYEITKLDAEGVLRDAHRTTGFPVVILRPVWVYGPGCPRTDKLFRSIARGRFVVAGRGDTLRHSIYIGDAVEAFERAVHAVGAPGEVFVVGDEGAVTIRELVDEIARLVGGRRPPSVPAWALRLAGTAAEAAFKPLGREPPISRRTLRFFTGNTSFRTDKARRVLGFEARYSLAAGLAETHRIRERGEFWALPRSAAPGD